MGDVRGLVKRLALGGRSSQVEAKAFEYVRVATARLGTNALGNFEVCKAAVCVDLACVTLQVPVDSTAVMLSSGVSSVVYKNARAMLQKALGVRSTASPRDLCVQFGCAKLELPLRTTLAAFKQKYLQRLAPGDRAGANFANPIFLAAVFSLVARKHKVKIARERLLTTLGLTSSELHRSINLVAEVVPDLVTMEERKGKEDQKTKKRSNSGDSGNEDKEENDAIQQEDKDSVPGDNEEKIKRQKKSSSSSFSSPSGKKVQPKKALTEKKLRQAVLSYAADEGPSTKNLKETGAKVLETRRETSTRAQTRASRAAATAGGAAALPAF